MIAFKTVSIVRDGRPYNGTWLLDGRTLSVSSAYGSKAAKLAKSAEVEDTAKAILAELVEAWRPELLSCQPLPTTSPLR